VPGNKPKTDHLPKWAPGTSGNPQGVPRTTLERRKALTKLYDMSVEQLKSTLLSQDVKPEQKDKVAMYICDQVIGRAKSEIDLHETPMPKSEIVDRIFEILTEDTDKIEADKKELN